MARNTLNCCRIRDQLAELEPLLTAEELEALGVADATLAAQAPRVQRELQRFVDLAVYRREHNIPRALVVVPRRDSACPAPAFCDACGSLTSRRKQPRVL